MLTFVHLSDIHFRNRDHLTQFDLDQQVRNALLEDLSSKPAGKYDGLLLTGDIAFGGKREEYAIARSFLDEVFAKTGLTQERTVMVPGNHDVDRDYVAPKLPLWDCHEAMRQMTDIERTDSLNTQLHKDPNKTLLSPLGAYNYFAQAFGCATKAEQLAWTRVFPVELEDGTLVKLHGLNSAMISDEADAPGKLLVSEFQTAHLRRDPDAVNVVLCHHPPDWLIDKQRLRQSLDAYVQVALFGHDHTTYSMPLPNMVQLFAGAVQPSRRDPNWVPTYHILQLFVSGTGATRDLVVRVHTREFSAGRMHRFYARRNTKDEPLDEHRIKLVEWTRPAAAAPEKELAETDKATLGSSNLMSAAEHAKPTPAETAQRELLGYFFRLGTPLRYSAAIEAGLVREGDDMLDPRVMWEEVFNRAVKENRLAAFWSAVAKHIPELRGKTNPFNR